jgi:thiol-disulfide isomerase/thioredoxin
MEHQMLVKKAIAAVLTSLTLVVAGLAQSNIVADVRAAITAEDLARAERIARNALARRGAGPEALEAFSWVARGAFATGDLATADRVAREAQTRAEATLKTRPLDAEPHLPLALGAAFEVQAHVLAAQGGRSDAVYLLTRVLEKYGQTSIQQRIQKNIHLLSLAGKPAIPLETGEFLGANRTPLQALKGRPLVLFFWAHWCMDCKVQGPILAKLLGEFSRDGLTIVAPTQRYGTIGGREVSAAEERRHIAVVREQSYEFLEDVPMPLSGQNFRNYGVSSTPTLVLVDRDGIVRLYHPGRMTEPALRAAIRDLVSGRQPVS